MAVLAIVLWLAIGGWPLFLLLVAVGVLEWVTGISGLLFTDWKETRRW